jgi:hypothetical protein
MKRTLLVSILVILSSCNKEEIFSPDRYIETENIQLGSYMVLNKEFIYSKKQLASVNFKNGSQLTFEYNSDKTVKRIVSSEKNNTYAVLSYKDKKVSLIQYYEEGNLARENVFSRKDKGVINQIESYVYDGFAAESSLSAMLFSETKSMPETIRKAHKSGGKSLYAVQNITYEKDNIFRVRLSYAQNDNVSLYSTTSYTYDSKKNPYYGLPYAFLQLTGYSKNNVIFSRMYKENDKYKSMVTTENTYTYEKKYPVYCSTRIDSTYAIHFDANNLPDQWQTDSKRLAYEYFYKK